MNIDLTKLINNFSDTIEINEVINFDDSYIKNTDIRKLDDVKVNGIINKTETDIYNLYLVISGEMTLPCAITLEDVQYPFSICINEILSDVEETDEKYFKINGNSIDIMPIIWQNIVLEVPLRIVSEESYKVNRSGDGWCFISDEAKKDNKINPKFEELNKLLDD